MCTRYTQDEAAERDQSWGRELGRFELESSEIQLAYLLAVRDRVNEVIADFICKPAAGNYREDAIQAVNAVMNCDRVTQVVADRIEGFEDDLRDGGLNDLHRHLLMNFE